MYVIIYVLGALFLVALRVLLIVGVAHDSKRRDTNSSKLWIILTALIGFICAVTYAVFVPKKNDEQKAYAKKNNVLISVLFVLVIIGFALYITFFAIPKMNEWEEESANSFPYDALTYKNENGEDVICDKMGNMYTYDEWDNFRYYDRDGNAYVAVLDNDYYMIGYKNVETNEEFITSSLSDSEYEVLFDSEGYICFFDDDTFYDEISIYDINDDMDTVYFDNNGNLYYYGTEFNYDDKGNVIFKNSDYKNFTYSDIPKEEFECFNLE